MLPTIKFFILITELPEGVPNRRVGQNKHAGGKILKKNNVHADQNKAVQGGFFSRN